MFPVLVAALLFLALPSGLRVADELVRPPVPSSLRVEANGGTEMLRRSGNGWRVGTGGDVVNIGDAVESALVRLGAGTSTPLRFSMNGAVVTVARQRRAGSIVLAQWVWSLSMPGGAAVRGVERSQGDAVGAAFARAGWLA